MTVISDESWYVVQTQSNAEAKAARHLDRQGFKVYLPRYLKRRSHARKVERVPAPLFPRYLFVHIDMAAQRWRSIQSTVGVSQLVSSGNDPSRVPSGVVQALREKEDESGFVVLDRAPKFIVGDKIRILAGAFSEIVGLFDGLADRERIAVLLDLLGQKVRVSMDADMVEAA